MEENEEKIKKIFLKTLEGLREEDFALEKKQGGYENWDSFAHMNLMSEVESEFGVRFETEEVIGIESAKDILEILNKKNG